MSELNYKQITNKLNSEFTGEVRKLVFGYDANAEFVDDVDTTTNYLVYASFLKSDICENHLEDTIKYLKEFFTEKSSLLTLELGIDERYKPVIQQYIKFFGEKKCT